MMKFANGAVVVWACTGAVYGQWSDDFDRPNGPIGGNWTALSGTWAIAGNQGTHGSTPANEILAHNTASMAYHSSVSHLDVFGLGSANQYSGLLIGLGGANAILVKLQNQNGVPGFSHIGIYRGSSSTGWGAWPGNGTGFAPLTSTGFTSARLSVFFSDTDTLVAEIDTDFNGVADQVYTKDGVSSFAGNLGTGFGIAAWQATAVFDNWRVVPVPAPSTLILLGAGWVMAARRRRNL